MNDPTNRAVDWPLRGFGRGIAVLPGAPFGRGLSGAVDDARKHAAHQDRRGRGLGDDLELPGVGRRLLIETGAACLDLLE